MIDTPPHEIHYQLTINPLEGGQTASAYLVDVQGKSYVLKFLDSDAPLSDTLKEMWLTQLASEKGIAPALVDVDLKQRALLLEYFPGTPLDEAPTTARVDALKKLKVFHQALPDEPFDALYDRYKKIQSALNPYPKVLDEVIQKVRTIHQIIARHGKKTTLCHHDFHSQNILCGRTEAKLIDWSAAGFGHPYYDIAKLTINLSTDNAMVIFSEYLEAAPTDREAAEFHLIRSLVWVSMATNRWLKPDRDEDDCLKLLDAFLKFTNSGAYRTYLKTLQDIQDEDLTG